MGSWVGLINSRVSGVRVVRVVGDKPGETGACVLIVASAVGTAGSVTVAEAWGVRASVEMKSGVVEVGVDVWHAVNRIARAPRPIW